MGASSGGGGSSRIGEGVGMSSDAPEPKGSVSTLPAPVVLSEDASSEEKIIKMDSMRYACVVNRAHVYD